MSAYRWEGGWLVVFRYKRSITDAQQGRIGGTVGEAFPGVPSGRVSRLFLVSFSCQVNRRRSSSICCLAGEWTRRETGGARRGGFAQGARAAVAIEGRDPPGPPWEGGEGLVGRLAVVGLARTSKAAAAGPLPRGGGLVGGRALGHGEKPRGRVVAAGWGRLTWGVRFGISPSEPLHCAIDPGQDGRP